MEPVKLINANLVSSTSFSPISLPPVQRVSTDFGIPFLSRTSIIILVQAIPHKGVVGEDFHIVRLPQTAATQKFQPKTAVGKLKAEITPIKPKGFHYSIII